jgi:hypothetical protein
LDETLKFKSDLNPENNCTMYYNNFFVGMFSLFESVPYTINIIQFFLVTLIYVNVGKGKYWKILFYVSIASLCGTLLECSGDVYIHLEDNKGKPVGFVYPFLIEEIFCIIKEYSVPVLNLIKMKAFSQGTLAKVVNYIIAILFIPFAIFRFMIGYTRMKEATLVNSQIQYYHGGAFFFMAISDAICTCAILYFVKKYNTQAIIKEDVTHFIKRSSYTILVIVDLVSFILSILQIIASKNEPMSFLIGPFKDMKYAFILILAVDALLFKYNVNVSSLNESYENYTINKESSNTRGGNQNFSLATNITITSNQNRSNVSQINSSIYTSSNSNNNSNTNKSINSNKNRNTYLFNNDSNNIYEVDTPNNNNNSNNNINIEDKSGNVHNTRFSNSIVYTNTLQSPSASPPSSSLSPN